MKRNNNSIFIRKRMKKQKGHIEEKQKSHIEVCGRSFWLKSILLYLSVDFCIAFLFYNSPIVFLILLPAMMIYIKYAKKGYISQYQRERKLQFREAMISMYALIAAGYSLESAIRSVPGELALCYEKDTWIIRSFEKMAEKLKMNVSAQKCLEDFAEESGDEDITSFYEVICIAKRYGGSMSVIIKMAIDKISRRIETECEIMTMMAGRKNEFMIMACVPAGIILYMRLSSPELMEVLYTQAAGRVVMTICLAVYTAAVLWGKRMTERALKSV